MNPIDGGGTVFDVGLTHRIEHRQRLLSLVFWGHEAHRGASCRLADRFGIGEVVLVAFHVRAYQMRCNELGRMSQFGDFLRHEMGTATGFHYDRTRFEVRQMLSERHPIKLFSVKLMTSIILGMQMEGMFSKIDGGNSYFVHGNGLR
ncbi:hypothetical protein D3C81_1740180 [compost metagenome]